MDDRPRFTETEPGLQASSSTFHMRLSRKHNYEFSKFTESSSDQDRRHNVEGLDEFA